jgi:hypothetical protein
MTQAYNLSQLANNLNTSGQLDATDGLVNAVPLANGGTNASTAAAARTNLDVPSTTGGGASGTWPINGFQSTNFTVQESGGKLIFKYGATTIASLDSSGNFVALGNAVAGGTP